MVDRDDDAFEQERALNSQLSSRQAGRHNYEWIQWLVSVPECLQDLFCLMAGWPSDLVWVDRLPNTIAVTFHAPWRVLVFVLGIGPVDRDRAIAEFGEDMEKGETGSPLICYFRSDRLCSSRSRRR